MKEKPIFLTVCVAPLSRLVALLCALRYGAGEPCGDSREVGTFYDGNDLAWKTHVATSQACAALCKDAKQCHVWSYFSPPKRWEPYNMSIT